MGESFHPGSVLCLSISSVSLFLLLNFSNPHTPTRNMQTLSRLDPDRWHPMCGYNTSSPFAEAGPWQMAPQCVVTLVLLLRLACFLLCITSSEFIYAVAHVQVPFLLKVEYHSLEGVKSVYQNGSAMSDCRDSPTPLVMLGLSQRWLLQRC